MADGFTALCATLSKIDLFGTAGDAMPRGAALAAAVQQGAPLLPPAYAPAYVAPLQAGLARLSRQDPTTAETLTAAVYQHAGGNALAPLHRFLAVISDLYRSFLDRNKRADAGVPLVETLPPLAMFQHDGANGPFTLPIDAVQQIIGGSAGVVSMPATYADHPVIWAALSHETGGHDVTHADTALLPELAKGIAAAFAGMPNDPSISRDDLARLWAYWIDESSADIYGLLNCGPAFVPNLAAFFGALNARGSGGAPALRMESGFSQDDPDQLLDPHPTDLVRLNLGIGAIESLDGLSAATRSAYVRQINDLATRLASADQVTLAGNIPGEGGSLQPMQARVPLGYMQQAARSVGGYIATAKLQALNGHSIQDIETWDDADEAKAVAVKGALLAGRPIGSLGDDAQLMAGATLALLEQPDRYNEVTRALNDGLDRSFQADPIWGVPPVDAAYIRYAKELVLR